MTFIATEPLFVGNARAHNPGDEVPAENVEANGWQDSVVKAGTKAAEKALAEAADVTGDQEGVPTTAQAPAKRASSK
jgi:hypothetical protein